AEEDQEQSLEETMAAAERGFATLDAMSAQIDATSAQFFAECLRVIPSHSVCTCLRDDRPAIVRFELYVSLIYKEGEIVERIDDYSPDDQELFRATTKARDKCSE